MTLNYPEIHDQKYQNDPAYRAKLQYQGHASDSLAWLMEHGDISECSLLDYGCGPGRNAISLALSGARVSAYDPSSIALGDLRRSIEAHHIPNDLITIQETPTLTGRYDVILVCYVVHFMPCDEARTLIHDLLGCLKAGGYLCIEYFDPETAGYRADRFYPSREVMHTEIQTHGSYELLWNEEHTSGEVWAQRVAQMSVWQKRSE